MIDLADVLDAYPDLTPDERAEVDAHVVARPEWAEAHARARQLAALLDAARAPFDGDDLARQAVARRMGAAPAGDDGPLDGALGPEAAAIEARLDAFEAEAEDPVARFERLTGRTLGGRPAPDRSPRVARPARCRRVAARWAATAVAALMLGYGGLIAYAAATTTTRQQVADLGAIVKVSPADRAPGAERLAAALADVNHARKGVVGRCPSYHAARLDSAATRLAAVATDADASSWVSQEARLALGRLYLYRQQDVEAAHVLGGLVREGGYRAPAARRMLDFVRAGSIARAKEAGPAAGTDDASPRLG